MTKESSNSFIKIIGLIIAILAFSTAIFQWMTKEKPDTIPQINIENTPVFNNENSTQSEKQKKQADKIRELEEKAKKLENELKKRNADTKPQITNPSTQDSGVMNTSELKGEWLSPEYKYSFKINGSRGIATLSNSTNYKVGDYMLLIKSFDGEYYHGKQIYTDGKWHEVKLKLLNKDEMIMYGGVEWTMIRKG